MALLDRWNNYWFRPAPMMNLAVCRIIIVGFYLHALLTGSQLAHFQTLAGMADSLYEPLPFIRLMTFWGWAGWDHLFLGAWNFRPPLEMLQGIYWATVAAGFCAFVGWRTQVSLFLFALGSLFMVGFNYSFGDHHHTEAIILITLLAFSFGPAGGMLSIDDLRRRRRVGLKERRFKPFDLLSETNVFAGWPLLLVRWIYGLIYFSAAACKMATSGLDWMNGYTLQYFMSLSSVREGGMFSLWLGQQHEVAVLLSWFTVLFEGTFFLAVVFPGLAILFVLLGIAFHLGIYIATGAGFFSFMVVYAVFIPWSRWLKILVRPRAADAAVKKSELLYDGHCPLCIRSMTGLAYFDWGSRIRFRDVEQEWEVLKQQYPQLSREACLEEMHLVTPDGKVYKGFFAFRAILKHLPLLMPLQIFFYLPLASAAGPRIYRWVASRRLRFQRCDWDSCEVHA